MNVRTKALLSILIRRGIAAVLGLLVWAAPALAQTGSITGVVVDSETGETLIGVNVVIEGTATGAATDLDGRYQIKGLDPGTYTLNFSYIGYNPKTVQGVEVQAGEATRIDISLVPEAIGMDEVVVEARSVQNTEASLLNQRQKAASVSDAISAEAIGRSGSSTAADAMEKVTGASVVGGKYVYVRGLGDRYLNAQLNGANLPSADPERNAVPLDLFPSGLLDNIVTTKTFTPDQPGNFTGGSVNIGTKGYPESLSFSFSSSVSYNTNVGIDGDLLLYENGRVGFFGQNGGDHDLPDALTDPDVDVPDLGSAFTDAEKAQTLDRLSKSFNAVMAPTVRAAPANQSYSFSAGNQFDLGGRPLGVVASLSYNHQYSGYTDGTTARWQLTGKVSETETLNNDFLLTDREGTEEVLWGGLANVSFKPHSKHELGINLMRNRSATSSARYQAGAFPRDLSSNEVYETRTLEFVERTLNSIQGRGEHAFTDRGLKLEWNSTRSVTRQNEPDLRFFTNNFLIRDRNGTVDTLYSIQPSIYPEPTRYFRDLDEDSWVSNASLHVPFKQWDGLSSKVKIGGSYTTKERTFRERRFEVQRDARSYEGDPLTFFDDEYTGILEDRSTETFFRFGNYIQDASERRGNYDGDQKIAAVFAMIDLPITKRLRAIGGARLETTQIDVASQDSTLERGILDNDDLLPSLNLVYALTPNMNVRAAYGRTLARPTFREIAPYANFSFVGDYIFIGNPDLKRTLVDNIDVRWEWFTRPGEIYAVSAFYKSFNHPIERAINPVAANPEIQFRNVDEAMVAGLELEARKQLDQLTSVLQHVQVGANVSLVHSKVDIAPDELELIRAFDPDASTSRSLQGQSPYTINVDATYDNPNWGTTVSAYYNVFGERLDKVSIGGTPDIYEQPRNIVDVTLKQRLDFGFSLKASVKNLFNERFELAHTFKDETFITQAYEMGRSISIGISYGLD